MQPGMVASARVRTTRRLISMISVCVRRACSTFNAPELVLVQIHPIVVRLLYTYLALLKHTRCTMLCHAVPYHAGLRRTIPCSTPRLSTLLLFYLGLPFSAPRSSCYSRSLQPLPSAPSYLRTLRSLVSDQCLMIDTPSSP